MSGKLGQLCCSERKISTTMLQRVGTDTTKTQCRGKLACVHIIPVVVTGKDDRVNCREESTQKPQQLF